MYYIRLLHVPRFEAPHHDHGNKKALSLVMMVAICNDLGEQRLSPRESIRMTLTINSSALGLPDIVVKYEDKGSFYWASDMWIRKAEPRFSTSEVKKLFADGRSVWVNVDLVDQTLAIKHAKHLVPRKDEPQGKTMIFPVYCECGWADMISGHPDVVRRLILADASETPGKKSLVFETADDIGDSIASHVWDSGITMAAFYADVCLRTASESSQSAIFPTVKALLQKDSLSVLELGAGVCSQGIGLASVLSFQPQVGKSKTTIVMTDVDLAEKRAIANIDRFKKSEAWDSNVSIRFEILDWEDGAKGVFGRVAQSQAWDLILVSDCTYNYDTIPSLVQTFSAIHDANLSHSTGMASRILLSTKQRHESETIFFHLVNEAGWVVREQGVIPFPVAENAADEDMEIYLFEKQ